MRKFFALLVLFSLLVTVFGSVVVSGVHSLVHSLDGSGIVVLSAEIEQKAHVHEHEHHHHHHDGHGHDHGDGYHEHGYLMTTFLNSFEYQKAFGLLEDVGQAFQWVFNFPWTLEQHEFPLKPNFPPAALKVAVCGADFLDSMDLDVPSPPPRFV